ncbi:MAG: polysaccharide biosynthesis protein [Acidobacteria bacterium]|nr:polysaccharide biosynthesis protein [Acidobacteriota bacterium]
MTTFTERELAHLLGRPVRQVLSPQDRRAFAGRRVLITGAGGSIGSELARQVAACGPERLTLVDHSEHALFQIEREIAPMLPDRVLDPVLADVTRSAFVRQAFRHSRPHVVYHAAAYKHVTMSERAVCAASNANVLGTVHVVTAARECGARFILISSDKAAAPTSVMGATKRLAELVVLREASVTFRPAVVRFGNVLGSSGSLLTILRDCIRAGQPVPVTDPDATRYFMTAGEAVSLVMKVDLAGQGGETYWLDMGEPIRIGDLVERMLGLEAENGFARVPTQVIGLRPGEKRQERLVEQGISMTATRHPRIWVARQPDVDGRRVDTALRALRRALARADSPASLAALIAAVPDFAPCPEALQSGQRDSADAVVAAGGHPLARAV